MYDQPITACYYHMIEKPIVLRHPRTHAALRVCVDALMRKKEKRTEKKRNALASLHLAWFEL